MKVRAPASARASTICRPNSPAPPVTTATRPVKSNSSRTVRVFSDIAFFPSVWLVRFRPDDLPTSLLHRRQGSQVHPQRLNPFFETAQRQSAAFQRIEEGVGLMDEQGVAGKRLLRLVMPRLLGLEHPAPTIVMVLKSGRALVANHRDGYFIGCLVLIEAVAAQYPTVPGQYMDGVLHGDAFEHLVGGVGREPVDRTDQPFRRIENVRQGVLDRPAAGGPVPIIGIPVRRPIRGKVLPARAITWTGRPKRPDAMASFIARRTGLARYT